jgi:hypothetical protein
MFEELAPIVLRYSRRRGRMRRRKRTQNTNSFQQASIVLISKPGKHVEKKNYTLKNID